MSKRAILYVRVSTDEQADRGYSLRDQEARLMNYCDMKGYEVSAIYREDHSAKNFNRPEYKKLLAFAGKNSKNIDLLLILKWDRFSRNTTEAYDALKKFYQLGIEVMAVEQPVDLSVPENKMMLAFYLSVPEVENERRSMNVRQGMRRAMKEGRWMATAPKGYSNRRDENNKPVIVVNEDSKWIKLAFEEIAKKVFTSDIIRRQLQRQGFRCSRSNFARLIRNPVYYGKIYIPAYKDEKEMLVKGIHEPIISESLFFQVQNIINGRRIIMHQPKIHRVKEELPLRGFIICPDCGCKMTGSGSKGNGGRYFYYHCSHCGKARFRADEVERKFLALLESYKITPAFKDLFLEICKDYLANEEKASIDAGSINTQIERLSKRIRKLQEDYADSILSAQDYYEMKDRFNREIQELKSKKVEINVQKQDMESMLAEALNLIENLDKFYVEASIETKQQLVGSIFPGKITFSENKVRTNEINEVVRLVCSSSKAFEEIKKGQPVKKSELSRMVMVKGVEPTE